MTIKPGKVNAGQGNDVGSQPHFVFTAPRSWALPRAMLADRRAGATLGEMQVMSQMLKNQLLQRQIRYHSSRRFRAPGLRPLDLIVSSAHRTLGATITARLSRANVADRVSDILILRDQTSTWRSFATISSGLCHFLAIAVLLHDRL
jgi:hypothetical protein